jgi:predicted dehydrogenase
VIGTAIVGCGLLGTKRARALADLGAPVIAVYDTDVPRAVALAGELGSRGIVASSPGEAFIAEGVELAVVSVTHDALVPIGIEAIEAGCHTLVEKPGARCRGELVDLEAAARRTGRVVRVGFNHRFHPSVRAAKKVLDGGEYGRVLYLRARYGHGGRPGYEKEWRADRDSSGGGELLDQGSHLIDLTRFLIGDVTLAFAELPTLFWPMSVEDNAFLALRGDSGGFAWLHASWTEWKNMFSMEVALERARLDLEGFGGSYGPEQLTVHAMRPEMGPPCTTTRHWDGPDDSFQLEVEDFVAEVGGSAPIGAGLEDAAAVLRVVEEAYDQ